MNQSKSQATNDYRYLDDYAYTRRSPVTDSLGEDEIWSEDVGTELPYGDSSEDVYGSLPSQVSKDQIQELYKKIQDQGLPDQEQLLGTLDEALKYLEDKDPSNDELVDEKWEEVSAKMEELEDGMDSGEAGGTAPSRIVKGIRYYESKNNQDFQFVPSGKGAETVIDTGGKVTISPEDPKAKVEISSEGDKAIVRVSGSDGDHIYKIKNASQIQIDSDAVSGDYESQETEVTVGSQGKKFVSNAEIQSLSSKLRVGAGLIGGYTDYEYGWGKIYNGNIYGRNKPVVALDEGKKYSAADEDKNQDVVQVLPKIADAIAETDPKKKAELWSAVQDDLKRWDTEQENKGHTNDRFRLLANVLYGELGEEGLKEALRSGLIPAEISDIISAGLVSELDESSSHSDVQWNVGGPDWTHATMADFFTKYAKEGLSLPEGGAPSKAPL